METINLSNLEASGVDLYAMEKVQSCAQQMLPAFVNKVLLELSVACTLAV